MNLISVRQYLKTCQNTALATHSHSVPWPWSPAVDKGRAVHHQGTQSMARLAPPAWESSEVCDTSCKQP